jgi:cell division protein FtsB
MSYQFKKIKIKSGKLQTYALIALCLIFGISLIRNITRAKVIKKRVEVEKLKIEELKAEQETLEEELQKVQSDSYLQKQLRDKLGLAKEGETVIILPDEASLRGLVPEIPEEESVLPDPIWKRWFKLFGI